MLNLSFFNHLPQKKRLVTGAIFVFGVLDILLRSTLPSMKIICNPGIAWGWSFPMVFIQVINIAILLALIWLWKREKDELPKIGWLLLIAGGSINGLDRLLLGCVRDYIHLPPFPIFNVADMMLSLGVGVLLLTLIRRQA